MSAYALPGLFPPIEFEKPKVGICSSSSSGSFSVSTALHERLFPENVSGVAFKEESEHADNTKLGIAVKEAKLDPVRLVQSITAPSRPKTSQQLKIRRRNSPDSLPSPTRCEKERSKGNPHEDAIEFELSISFNGRKYTAMRSMQCIVQLRYDLIREMNVRKQWLHTRRQHSQDTKDEDRDTIQIPEIPCMTDEEGSGGFVGRGFTMLHAVLSSYCPAMERWLRSVTTIVPQDSESLTNFLWEPLSKEVALDFAQSCSSLKSLSSIPELKGYGLVEEDEDSEDESEG
jgi:hypothetical protein